MIDSQLTCPRASLLNFELPSHVRGCQSKFQTSRERTPFRAIANLLSKQVKSKESALNNSGEEGIWVWGPQPLGFTSMKIPEWGKIISQQYPKLILKTEQPWGADCFRTTLWRTDCFLKPQLLMQVVELGQSVCHSVLWHFEGLKKPWYVTAVWLSWRVSPAQIPAPVPRVSCAGGTGPQDWHLTSSQIVIDAACSGTEFWELWFACKAAELKLNKIREPPTVCGS